MHVVLPGVGFGTVCVTVAAGTLCASSSVSGCHAWEPLQMWCRWTPLVRLAGGGTSSSWLGQLPGGEEAVKRQVVLCGSEPPCQADAWLQSPRVARRQSAPANERTGLVDELLSLQVTRLLVGCLC